jgi:hypothetical protein
MRAGRAGLALLATVLLASVPAWAQGSAPAAFELERLELNPNAQGALAVGTGELLPQGGWRLGLLGHYQNNPLVFYRQGQRVGSVVQHRVMGHLVGAWAPLRWLELSAQVPVVLYQQGQDLSPQGVSAVASTGLATPLLAARLGLLSQRSEAPLDLALELGVGLPVGNEAVFGRETGVRLVPRAMLGRSFGGLRAALEAGALVRQSVVLGDTREVQDELGSELRLGRRGLARRAGCTRHRAADEPDDLGARGAGRREAAAGGLPGGIRAGRSRLRHHAGHAHLPRAARGSAG